jgi:peptidyl-prolyl cis-trans isomerase SurA
MTRKLLTVVLAAGLMLAASCAYAADAVVIDRVVAVVGDDIITLSELQSEMAPTLADVEKRFRGDDLVRETDRLKRDALNQLIDRSLQLLEAKRLGIMVPQEDVDAAIQDIMDRNKMSREDFDKALAGEGYSFDEYKGNLEAQLLVIRLINREVRSKVLIDEADAKAYYEDNPDEFKTAASITLANIFFPADKGGMEQARENAAEARKKIEAGTPFEEMAVVCTGDDEAAKTCVLGSFKKGELSGKVEEVAFSLDAGEVSEPVKTEGGYQLIKTMNKVEAGIAPYDDAKEFIYEKLNSIRGEAVYANWLRDLRSNTYIEVRD